MAVPQESARVAAEIIWRWPWRVRAAWIGSREIPVRGGGFRRGWFPARGRFFPFRGSGVGIWGWLCGGRFWGLRWGSGRDLRGGRGYRLVRVRYGRGVLFCGGL